MDAYFLSHNGLGDNIISIGAVNYLSMNYRNVYFLCKDIYAHNLFYIFKNANIIPVPFDSNNETASCYNIISNKYDTCDVFVCGCHRSYLKSKITNENILNHIPDDGNFWFPQEYTFFRNFYHEINMDLQIFIKYFNICIDEEVKKIYDDISNYRLVFFHTQSSNTTINLNNCIRDFIDNENYLVINPNESVYDKNNKKYDISNKYINLRTIFHYYYLIMNAEHIYVVNSSFSCIVIGLHYKKLLRTKNPKIFCRQNMVLYNLQDFALK